MWRPAFPGASMIGCHTYLMYGTAVHGRNGHKLDESLSFGVSYGSAH